MPLLPSLFSGSLTSPDPTLVVVSDSLLQPGVLILRHFISSAIDRNEAVVVLALEHSRSRLVPPLLPGAELKLDFIDACPSFPFASSSSTELDYYTAGGVGAVTTGVVEAIRRRRSAQKSPVLVVVDSSDEVAALGTHVVFSLFKSILRALEGLSGSRLVTLQHNLYPQLPSASTSSISASLSSTLLSSSLSPSTVHLILHPPPLLELLSREYGLSIPLDSFAPLDIRLYSFLASFASRSWGDPFIRPESSKEDDERVPLDMGGKLGCGFVVEWSCRGLAVPGEAPKRGEVKKLVLRGVEAARRTLAGLESGALKDVLQPEKMSRHIFTEHNIPAVHKPLEPLLPFNLSLTDSQRAAREEVILPYLPREAEIAYAPDEGDDMDDDDPDEDLEL